MTPSSTKLEGRDIYSRKLRFIKKRGRKGGGGCRETLVKIMFSVNFQLALIRDRGLGANATRFLVMKFQLERRHTVFPIRPTGEHHTSSQEAPKDLDWILICKKRSRDQQRGDSRPPRQNQRKELLSLVEYFHQYFVESFSRSLIELELYQNHYLQARLALSWKELEARQNHGLRARLALLWLGLRASQVLPAAV